MHLKSIGALCARTLSYESCEFELVDGISDDKVSAMYNKASEIWTALHSQLLDRCTKMKRRDDEKEKIDKWIEKSGELTPEMHSKIHYHLELHRDSDSESDHDDDDKMVEESKLRRTYRERKAKNLLGKNFDSSLMNVKTEPFIPSDMCYLLYHRIVLVCSSKVLSKSLHCQQGRYRYLSG